MPIIAVKIPIIYFVCITLGYIFFELLHFYKIIIQAIIDRRKKDYVTEVVSVHKFNAEYSHSRNGFGYGIYPKDMSVSKYKINVVDKHGEKKKLRSVMSLKRSLEFISFKRHQIDFLQVTYLKRSKILVYVDLVDELDSKITKKGRKEIESALRAINTTV